MKLIVAAVLALSVVGCATHQKTVISNNPDLLVVGSKPEGYPKTHIEPYPNFPGFCIEAKESWREDNYQGQTIWLKDRELKSMQCPK